MKRGTPDHPKTLELMRRLDLKKYEAVGVLECLWQFTAEYAKRGDVGRYSDEQLARAIEWDRDAGELVAGLVAAGWLKRRGRRALIVVRAHPRRRHIPIALRRAVYERDGYGCRECGSTEDLSLDHVVPYSQDGPDTLENLRVLCVLCNSRKGAR